MKEALEEMWAALAAYQPQADKDGHGKSWAKMCREKTSAVAADATSAAADATSAAAYAAAAALAASYAAVYAEAEDGYADYAAEWWSQKAIDRINLLIKPAQQEPVAWVDEATHYQPQQKAFYKRVSATEWYVWSRIEQEPLHWCRSLGTSDGAHWILRHPARHDNSDDLTIAYTAGLARGKELALAEQPAQQCKWPTCQNEEYQQALADQIKRELAGEQPAQHTEQEIVALRKALASSLDGVYVCDRAWSAWSVGTMSEDDFYPASESDEVLDSLVSAVTSQPRL